MRIHKKLITRMSCTVGRAVRAGAGSPRSGNNYKLKEREKRQLPGEAERAGDQISANFQQQGHQRRMTVYALIKLITHAGTSKCGIAMKEGLSFL